MRAVRNTDAGVAVVDVPEPEGPGVRVRVRAAGICGSDLEMVEHGIVTTTIGHEFAGVLDDDSPVAVQPYVACGECESCRSGAPQLCKTMGASMLGVFADGGMADEVVVDPSCLSPLPDGVRVEDASLVEPLAVSLHACNRVGIEPGMRVGVVGAGTIGLLSALVAQHLGAEVHVVARHDAQRVALEKLGIAADGGRNCDTVIEAAGTASAFDDAVRRCRRGGTISLVSTTWSPIEISFLAAQMREATLVPSFMYGHAHGEREFDAAAAILAAHPELPATLITHRFALDEAPHAFEVAAHPELPATLITHRFGLDEATHAFEVAADRSAGTIKVVLHP